jgi:hypothetical protein
VHQADARTQVPDLCHLTNEARSLEPLIEQWLMGRSNLAAAFEVRPIERDKIAFVVERRSEGLASSWRPQILIVTERARRASTLTARCFESPP